MPEITTERPSNVLRLAAVAWWRNSIKGAYCLYQSTSSTTSVSTAYFRRDVATSRHFFLHFNLTSIKDVDPCFDVWFPHTQPWRYMSLYDPDTSIKNSMPRIRRSRRWEGQEARRAIRKVLVLSRIQNSLRRYSLTYNRPMVANQLLWNVVIVIVHFVLLHEANSQLQLRSLNSQ